MKYHCESQFHGLRGFIAFSALMLTACTSPTITALDPPSGPTHTLIDVQGAGGLTTGIYWDAGLAGEQQLNRTFLSGDNGPISAPDAAANGAHPVQKRNSKGDSSIENFTVVAPVAAFPAPRLEYVTTCCWSTLPSGDFKFILFTSSANIDAHAQTRIGGVAQDTAFWQGARYNDAINLATLNYPLFHYGMHLTTVEAGVGDVLAVSMINDGGLTSNVINYTVPAINQRDDDGDGLLNTWETNGYDADGDGTVDVDLPALGADPNHKDVFVEVDFMNGKVPAGDPWTTVETAFANAPIFNFTGGPGIHLHIDRGQANWTDSDGNVHVIPAAERDGGTILPFSDRIRYDAAASPCAGPGETTVNFHTLKAANFDANRLNVFHYSVFANAHGYSCSSSGRGEIYGNDLFVTLSNARLAVPNSVSGTFMHEFGHNLNLRHGGGDDNDNTQNEPNHQSIMSYYSSNGTFGGSYQVGGIDTNCDTVADAVYDFSRGRLNALNEAALNENTGICNNVAINWNNTGGIQNPVAFDIDGSATTVLDDFNSWGHIYLNFRAPGSGWGSN